MQQMFSRGEEDRFEYRKEVRANFGVNLLELKTDQLTDS